MLAYLQTRLGQTGVVSLRSLRGRLGASMATFLHPKRCFVRGVLASRYKISSPFTSPAPCPGLSPPTAQHPRLSQRQLNMPSFSTASASPSETPSFAFAFDIDGVLLHSKTPLPGATETLQYLQEKHIPFILLTNSGGKTEKQRVTELSKTLSVALTEDNFVQSHTPFRDLDQYKDKTILVTGQEPDKCRMIAETYGFKNVLIPADFHNGHRTIWPFNSIVDAAYVTPTVKAVTRPLPKPIATPTIPPGVGTLKVDAILVFNDPRDWAFELQLMVDLLSSSQGYVGTWSGLNGQRSDLPNGGWQQDGQPALFFSHQDMTWATGYHLPRLAQGAFQAALVGLWHELTDGRAELVRSTIGKPHREMYLYAERTLNHHARAIQQAAGHDAADLRTVYMIGDNPDSDIKGANDFESTTGAEWVSLLVRTGVWHPERGGETPKYEPKAICDDVKTAVQWALKRESMAPEGFV